MTTAQWPLIPRLPGGESTAIVPAQVSDWVASVLVPAVKPETSIEIEIEKQRELKREMLLVKLL